MPIYEYRCKKCGAEFEYMQTMSERPKRTCEACRGKLEKLISAAAFQFKGGGWYKDLYASAKPGAAAESAEGGSKGDAAGDASKSADKAGASSGVADATSAASSAAGAAAGGTVGKGAVGKGRATRGRSGGSGRRKR
jgi:putative FmdB family regulatory protein